MSTKKQRKSPDTHTEIAVKLHDQLQQLGVDLEKYHERLEYEQKLIELNQKLILVIKAYQDLENTL